MAANGHRPGHGPASQQTAAAGGQDYGDRYRWVALANPTAAMFMAPLDGSIAIIALPAIFRGIHLDPLAPGNIGSAPNTSSIMSSVPARHRGAASGMRSTFQNSGTALSIGVFFSLMIAEIGRAHV